MKKLVFIAAVVGLGLTSCKKDYECCWHHAGDDHDHDHVEDCTTTKMSKSEAEEAETTKVENGETLEYHCELK